MKTTTQKMTLAFKNSHHEIFKFKKTKFLIGTHPSCDLLIEDSSVSEIHALVSFSEAGIEVLDLQSINGIFINGIRTHKATLNDGDTLTIGSIHFSVVDISEEYDIITHDQQVVAKQEIEEKVFVPQTHNEKAVLIDDEYCDIVFEENNRILTDSPLHRPLFNAQNYIELDLSDSEYEIINESDEKAILITTLSNGVIINQKYFSDRNKTIYATGNSKKVKDLYIELLAPEERLPFIQLQDGQIICQELNEVKLATSGLLDQGKVVILNYKSYQIMVELTAAPSTVKNIPFWLREKDFYKQATKVFAGIFLPVLLLLLVDFQIEKKDEKKEVAIIYKKAQPVEASGQDFAIPNPNSKTENTGHRPNPQQEAFAEAKKGPIKKTPKKAVAQAKASAAKPSPQKKAAKSPVKAYSLNIKSNIKNLFAGGSASSASSTRKSVTVDTNGTSSGIIDTRVSNQAGGEVGKLGLDNSGSGEASGGVRGLASKKGLETSYIEPRTVVLGSMDPELLRKILREYLPQFRHCYQQELAYNSEDIQGIVDLNFEISPSGKVSKINIKTKDSRFSKKGVDCMGKVLSIINFPKPKGGGRVAVRQPLSFFSEKERG